MSRRRLLAAGGATVAALALLASVGVAPTQAAVGSGASLDVAAGKPTVGCGGERPFKPGGGRYSCSFEDDFAGSTLDTSKWIVQETAWSGVHLGDRGCYVNDPDNVSVGGGLLRLTSRVEDQPFVCKSPTGDYTTDRTVATVASAGRFAQTYGRFEFRAKFPVASAQGIHSALWLYPQKHTYGSWPSSGEIDVAEWFSGEPSRVYPSVHYAGENLWESTGFNCPMPGATTGYHRYAVEWTPSVMRFLYDGNLCFQHSWTPDAPLVAPQPFDHPFYVVLSQAFGGGWNAITADTPTSATLQVDWVRAWK